MIVYENYRPPLMKTYEVVLKEKPSDLGIFTVFYFTFLVFGSNLGDRHGEGPWLVKLVVFSLEW